MGYIKKLKNNELVGGTDKHTIYPVTSTKAVFEEVTEGDKSSFKSQETINKEQQDELDNHEERIQAAEAEDIKSITINGSTKEFRVDGRNNVDLTIYTVDNDPEMPSIASNVEDLRNMVGTSTPVLETSHKTRIETLEGGESVTGSVENKIKTKVDSINSSYQDDNNEYVKYSMTQTSGEVTNFNIDETNLKNAITSLNTSISGDNIVIRSGSTPSGTGEAGKIYRYVNSSNNTYTDYMYSGGSWVALATHDTSNEQAQVAYYTCTATGSGAQATKQFVGSGSLTYNPSSGGHIKILMGEANTATGTIYLQFGTTTSTKKLLYYNGESVSSDNTWEAGETIAVYYDPSANNNAGAYFASNAQGGGKAEKIKYDNSQSGLAAENVQGALDEVSEETMAIKYSYNLSGFTLRNGLINGSGEYVNSGKYISIPVVEGDTIKIVGNASNTSFYAFMTASAISSSGTNLVTGTTRYTVPIGDTAILTIPATCKFLYINMINGNNNDNSPRGIYRVGSVQEVSDAVDFNVSEIKKNSIRDVLGWTNHTNYYINFNTLLIDESADRCIRTIEVSEGDVIYFEATFSEPRPFYYGLFSSLDNEETADIWDTFIDKSSYSGKIVADRDGYLAFYYHTSYPFVSFYAWKHADLVGKMKETMFFDVNKSILTLSALKIDTTTKTIVSGTSLQQIKVIKLRRGEMFRVVVHRDASYPSSFTCGFFNNYNEGSTTESLLIRPANLLFDEILLSPSDCYFVGYFYNDGHGSYTVYKNAESGRTEDVHANNRQEELMVKSLSRRLSSTNTSVNWGVIENTSARFVVAQITDTHIDTSIVTKRFIDWANFYMADEIDTLIHTGDVNYLQWGDTQYVEFNGMRGDTNNVPFLYALGNHDQSAYGNSENELADMYNRWIKPLVDEGVLTTGVTRSSGQVIEGDTYYYLDFADKKVRMIVLNDYDPMYDGFYKQSGHTANDYTKHRWSQNQIDMLIQALTTVPQNYTVVVARHTRPSIKITDTDWSVSVFLGLTPEGILINNGYMTNGRPIEDILNAYATKSTFAATTYSFNDSAVTSKVGSLSVPATDFTNANGDLAFVMGGHGHIDMVGVDPEYASLKIVICGNGGNFSGSHYQDVAREYVQGKGQDNFNVYVLDTDNRKVWVVKFGANFTLNGKLRQVTSFNY